MPRKPSASHCGVGVCIACYVWCWIEVNIKVCVPAHACWRAACTSDWRYCCRSHLRAVVAAALVEALQVGVVLGLDRRHNLCVVCVVCCMCQMCCVYRVQLCVGGERPAT